MNQKEIKLIKDMLGDDIFDKLEKSEIAGGIIKLNTNTATDPNEIKVALQIVPKMVLSYLFMNLKELAVGSNASLSLPFAEGTTLNVTKFSPDNYSGDMIQAGKRISEFRYRSLPGIGLILMSNLELYDIKQLDQIQPNDYNSEKSHKLQDIIDERIRTYSLIQSVVEKKMMERDALKAMIRQRLTYELNNIEDEEKPIINKKSKLKSFLEDRERNLVSLEIDKSEIRCPDCNTHLYKGENKISLCICYGEYYAKNIPISKKEGNIIKVRLPKDFGVDNTQMLREALKNK